MRVRPGRGGTIAAHVLFGIEEVGTTTPYVARAVASMLLNYAVDAGRISGGWGGRRPPPPKAHAENRALRESGEGGSISDPRALEILEGWRRETLQLVLKGPQRALCLSSVVKELRERESERERAGETTTAGS